MQKRLYKAFRMTLLTSQRHLMKPIDGTKKIARTYKSTKLLQELELPTLSSNSVVLSRKEHVMSPEMHSFLTLTLDHLLQIVLAVVTPFLVTWIKDELNKINLNALNDAVSQVVVDSIKYAEEQAHKSLKGEGKDLTGAEKLAHAMSFAQQEYVRLNLGPLVEKEFVRLVESKMSNKDQMKRLKELP
jgi:hypothetical protein